MNLISIFLLIIIFFFIIEYYHKSYYIIKKNFLDKSFIEKINKTILNDKEWLYTTNIGNDKIKHNNNIELRKENSLKLLNSDKFSYSKYEYKMKHLF